MTISPGTRRPIAVVARVWGHNNNIKEAPGSPIMDDHVETGLYNLPGNRPGELRNDLLKLWPWVKITRRKNS